jgi:3-methyladenine DNA glycosylase AlkD
MTVKEIMTDLKKLGDPKIKAILQEHGVREPLFGVRVGDMKPIQKKVKKDYQLAKELYATGNADAMYLAGLIADDMQMSADDLEMWVRKAVSQNISEYTVPWVAAGSSHGYRLALEWIDAKEEHIAAAGWATLASVVALKADDQLDIAALKSLLTRVVRDIQKAPNRVRYTMIGFVTAAGAYVTPLYKEAIAAAKKMGPVTVDVGGTCCKVPDAVEAIAKIEARGALGKKKKTVKC